MESTLTWTPMSAGGRAGRSETKLFIRNLGILRIPGREISEHGARMRAVLVYEHAYEHAYEQRENMSTVLVWIRALLVRELEFGRDGRLSHSILSRFFAHAQVYV